MAEVYRAESAGLEGFKKTVAIKRVLPHLSEKKQFIGMFLDEARVSAHLGHSNCVQVFDIGVGDNTYFIVMEYVDGADLKAIIENLRATHRQMAPELACLVCMKICEGLAYAHELRDADGHPMNIVHRDMSPPNVLVTRHGEVKIVDFGLAKANSQLEKSEPGIIKGKFSYLSPEAAQGKPVDQRTDIFAVGIILWELLAGRRLFLGETDLETVRQVQRAEVPPIRQFNTQVTPDLDRVIARGLAGDPTRRYQSAREFGRDLTQVLFTLGRPVSSFDIATLVEPIRAKREQDKRRQVMSGSIIGSLIDAALFEFTSLEQRQSVSDMEAQRAGGAVQDWASSLGDLGGGSAPSAPRHHFEAGNLSALEDDSPFGRAPSKPPGISSVPAPIIPSSAPAPVADDMTDLAAPSSSGKGTLVVIFLVVLLAGLAGAWFGGLIPKDVLG
jgi:serine/threonine-protein kinase